MDEARKSRFIVKVPMCRLLRVAALAFARSFFAFCAIGKECKLLRPVEVENLTINTE